MFRNALEASFIFYMKPNINSRVKELEKTAGKHKNPTYSCKGRPEETNSMWWENVWKKVFNTGNIRLKKMDGDRESKN